MTDDELLEPVSPLPEGPERKVNPAGVGSPAPADVGAAGELIGGAIEAAAQGAAMVGHVVATAGEVIVPAVEVAGSVAGAAVEAAGSAAGELAGAAAEAAGSAAGGCSCSVVVFLFVCLSAGSVAAATLLR